MLEVASTAGASAPASYDVVSATIPGSDPAAGEIVLTAHICHQQPGANDNASGSAALRRLAPGVVPATRGDARVAERDPLVRGPLSVYYYDHLEEVIGALPDGALAKRDELLAYEALNLVDGKRSVAELRDVLAGRVGPVSLEEVGGWLEILERAKVIRWKD